MKELVKHLIDNHLDEIVEKSILNCHTIGLHSVMLLESPEKTIRLYITDKNHNLYYNFPDRAKYGMSIGFHPHHCNLTLLTHKGSIFNWEVAVAKVGLPVTKYAYKSQITEDEMSFSPIQVVKMHSKNQDWIAEGYSIYMKANAIHTVAVMKGQIAAWFVFEGKEDKDYAPFCYTNSDPNIEIPNDLYKKPTKVEVINLLKSVELL